MGDTIKWIVVLAAMTGGTNVIQYLGIAAPEKAAVVEKGAEINDRIAMYDSCREDLQACHEQLRACYAGQ